MSRKLSEETKKKNRVRAKKWREDSQNKEHFRVYINPYLKQRRLDNQRKLNLICSVPCFDCGNKFPPECMDFDHLPQYKKRFELSKAGGRSWETILDEVLKCDIVCACCHRIRTKNRK